MGEPKGTTVYSEIPLVAKRCEKCNNIFRVLEGSPQEYCSRVCMIFDGLKPKHRFVDAEDYLLRRAYLRKYKIGQGNDW
jgi:hypothetical protein